MAKKSSKPAKASRPGTPAAAPAPPPASPTARRTKIKVEAIRMGYYELVRRRVGDVFLLVKPEDFCDTWMRVVSPSVPERTTTGQEELRRQHDEIMKERAPSVLTDDLPTGAGDPIGN